MPTFATAEGNIQRITKTKKIEVPLRLNPTRTVEAKTDDDTLLAKEFGIVSIICPGNHVQMTLHRPIGYNTLSGDDWVFSPSESVPVLQARKDHPLAGLYAKERRSCILTAYSQSDTKSKFDVDDDSLALTFYGYDRNILVKEARKASKAQWIADHPPQEDDVKKGLVSSEKEPDLHYIGFLKDPSVTVESAEGEPQGMTRLSLAEAKNSPDFLKYFPDRDKASNAERKIKLSEYNAAVDRQSGPRGNALLHSCEKLYLEFIKDKAIIKAAHDSVKEEPYETKSGQPATISQLPCPSLKGKSKEQACDMLMQLIASVVIK